MGYYFSLAHSPRPHLLFYVPQPKLLFHSPPRTKITFSQSSTYQNYFFTAPNDQNYYFMALLVENISCISVLSKFQIFQLKEDKICN